METKSWRSFHQDAAVMEGLLLFTIFFNSSQTCPGVAEVEIPGEPCCIMLHGVAVIAPSLEASYTEATDQKQADSHLDSHLVQDL